MGNLVTTIKRFLSNKNTVTILAVIAGVIILWYFYNSRVNAAITTIRIPYAIEGIDMGKRIETDNIGWKEITRSTVKDSDIILDISKLQGMYVKFGTSIPAGGFFFSSQISDRLPNSAIEDLPEGMTPYYLPVNSTKTYGNSIMPGDYIDLYIRAQDEDGKVVWGRLIKSIEVLAVKDSSDRDVFYDSTAGTSASLLFGVTEEYQKLLQGAQSIKGYQIEIIPMPRGRAYTQAKGDTQIDSQELYNFIIRNVAQM